MTALVPRNYSLGSSAPMDLFNMLDDFFSAPATSHRDAFKVDIREDENGYKVEADMPGVDKENIDIEMNEGKLTIGVSYDDSKEDKDEGGNYLYRERRHVSAKRGAYLKDAVADGISAKLENGVLTINVPKKSADANATKVVID